MSELAKAVDTIQREFKKRFGLEADIKINVFDTSQNIDVEKADKVARIVATELELCRPEHGSSDGSAWVSAERRRVSLSIFYPYKQRGRVLQCEQS
jgi:hypothetical protein